MYALMSQGFLPSVALFACASELPELTLPDLFQGIKMYQSPPFHVIDAVAGRQTETVTLVEQTKVTLEDLRRAHRFLQRLHPSPTADQKSAIRFYKNRLRQLAREPFEGDVDQYTLKELFRGKPSRCVRIRRTYESLSREAREGLYILLTTGEVPAINLVKFMFKWNTKIVENILRLVTMLYNFRVENFAHPFFPYRPAGDLKFLGSRLQRLGHLKECEYALWMANCTDATRVRLNQILPHLWSDLTKRECAFIYEESFKNRNIADELSKPPDSQQHTEIDCVVHHRDRAIAMEIKTSSTKKAQFQISPELEARYLLQVIRYALVVRHNHLKGIEYVIDANHVPEDFLKRLRAALDSTELPYLLRIESSKNPVFIENRLSYPVFYRPLPKHRTRALPPLPE